MTVDIAPRALVKILAAIAIVWLWLNLWQLLMLIVMAVVLAISLDPIVEVSADAESRDSWPPR